MKNAGSSMLEGMALTLRWLLPSGLLALAGILGGTAWSLLAQEPAGPVVEFNYESIPIVPKLRGDTPDSKKELLEINKVRSAVFKGDAALAGNQPQFDGYFNGLVFPKMTQPDEMPLLANHRREFFKQVAQIKTPEVHQHLMEITLKAMKVIAAGAKYHPAARHNAMLIIGELNDREMVATGDNKSPPDPMRNALIYMLDEVTKAPTPDYLRVAALVGIQRHVDLDQLQAPERRMPEVTRNQIIDKMTAMIAAPLPSDKSLAEGRQWIRRQAIEVLGAIGHIGVDGKVYATLLKVVNTATEPVLLRAAAAGAIGQLNFPQGFKADTKELIVQIATIPLVAVDEEGKRLEARAAKRDAQLEREGGLGGVGGGERFGGPPMIGPGPIGPAPIFGPQPNIGGGPDPANPISPQEKRDLDYARVASRRLRAIVAACYGSLAGIRSADRGLPLYLKATPEAAKPLNDLSKPLRALAEFLEDDIKDVYIFEENLKQRRLNLSQALTNFAPAKPAGAPMPMPMTPDGPDGPPGQ